MVKIEFTLEEKEAGKINITRKIKDKNPRDNEKVATSTIIELFNKSVEDYQKRS